jgi:hypothetical protein
MAGVSIDKFPGFYDSESVRGWRFLKAIFYGLIGIAMLLWMLFHRSPSGADLQKNGVQTEGRVTKMETVRNRSERISYVFTVNGRGVTADYRTVGDLDGLTRLGPITVWYDPADPTRCTTPNEMRGESAAKTVIPILIFAAMIVLAGYQIYAILWKGR